MPLGAKSVARPSKWGNPFVIGMTYGASGPNGEWSRSVKITDRIVAVAEYQRAIERGHLHYFPFDFKDRARAELAGLDLACWCPLPGPGEIDWCHAAVLLSIANEEV